ncbi:MAG: 50S ribosomal protein L32 [Clostridia bacterium]
MAVPKCKISRQRKHSRSSANWKLAPVAMVECSHCHELKENHKVCTKCGYYDKEQVIVIKEKKAN